MTKPHVLGIDPSGSFKEGKGTTGFALLNPEGELIDHAILEAKNYNSQLEYWDEVIELILGWHSLLEDMVISVEDYVLYASAVKAQINSEMETSKLIGAITIEAYYNNIPMYIRNAAQVKKRWSNNILEYKGLIQKIGNKTCDMKERYINPHSVDALRHALHCHYFELKEEN